MFKDYNNIKIMNTTENNKLIAEFIGEKGNDTEVVKDVYTGIPVNGMKTITVELERMKFHSSWDWLMPVVEKIESITTNVGFTIRTGLCMLQVNNNLRMSSIGYKYKSGIDHVYDVVIQFIKWYNENNNPTE